MDGYDIRHKVFSGISNEKSDLKIEIDLTPEPEAEDAVWAGLNEQNKGYASWEEDVSFSVFLRDPVGNVLGGVIAKAGRGWLHVRGLWVDSSLRGQGYGARLMAVAEAEGVKLGCHSAYLNTFSFQARPFYEGCGYEVFGTLDDFPEGHQRFFMRKSLCKGPGRKTRL